MTVWGATLGGADGTTKSGNFGGPAGTGAMIGLGAHAAISASRTAVSPIRPSAARIRLRSLSAQAGLRRHRRCFLAELREQAARQLGLDRDRVIRRDVAADAAEPVEIRDP